ncbi:MAG TPA: hypothetical protein DDX39_01845 [Bacteroidales bacterium]|nr:MAG: hypothetical protein A2W98_08060 [Bacteroidetes bacterium GWF2_33_38]OFY73712.1 MAG: hypothetical protein A2265_06415 [Bacteroidetes bacterium RIFOXYA12_FULL_33_9]HBF87355.1 hypothetical protein [Bacteroidales bacterium]
MNSVFVSIIIPCRNEEKFISNVLENILSQTYDKSKLEVIVADGISDDCTADIVKEFADKYSFIKLISNPYKIVPHALNMAIKASVGEVIIRMDAHSEYPSTYIERLVECLFSLNADNVGGVWINTPNSNSTKDISIAEALACPFGIGNAHYRTGTKEIKQVDTVPFGCYKREIFEKIGFFDQDLVRNQDDEFNARLIKNGGKIFLIPDVEIVYYPRKTIGKLIKMFYQYGLFKPLVNKKVGSPATTRQLVPPLFFLFLLTIPITLFFGKTLFLISLIFLSFYVLTNLIFSLLLSIKKHRLIMLFVLPIIFFSIHISYGYGYIVGIFKFLFFASATAKVEINR